MKKVLYQILSVFLAFVVLFSTFSFTVEKHLCGGEVVDYSVLGSVERCWMPVETDKNCSEPKFSKMPCCDDIVDVVEGTNSELKISKELNVKYLQTAIAFVYSYIDLFEGLEQNIIPFKGYSSPLVTKDIQVLYDTFLI